ncbi:MAG: Tim44 domain-containing protein [Thermodesulfobacteriota bacterium]
MPRARVFLVLILAAFFCLAGAAESWARAGGGKSMGSTGSRSLSGSSGSTSRPTQPQPGGQYQQQARPTPQQPGLAPQTGGFMRSLAGGLAGGFLGAMLFRGIAGAGTGAEGAGGSGPGLLDLILIGAVLYFGYRWFKRRRQAQAQAGAGDYQQAYQAQPQDFGQADGYSPPPPPPGAAWSDMDQQNDVERGINHIRGMEPAFDPKFFLDRAGDAFFMIQGAWARRDLSSVADLLTPEMLRNFQDEVDQLKARGQISRLENISVRSVDLSQAWQESGQDYISVHFLASLLDYTVDEKTGQVVAGSDREPVKFEELWTFTRPVGPGPWRLSAITQVN